MIGLSIAAITLTVLVATSIVWGTIRTGISPMPSSRRAMDAMLALAPEQVSGSVYELGSGWGLLAIKLAQRYPDAKVIGIEFSWAPYLVSKCVGYLMGGKNLTFQRADFRDVPLSSPALVVCYLYPEGMAQLSPILAGKLPSGSMVISNTFRLPGWTPHAVTELPDLYRTQIYRYCVPTGLPTPLNSADDVRADNAT
ncbi:MAG: class I SAM-dependent methyltransferase [Myxococcota bacterium]|nr:class I SAM-dependent methyltransferase [Myxococcota bacterium]